MRLFSSFLLLIFTILVCFVILDMITNNITKSIIFGVLIFVLLINVIGSDS